jgi:hypothetical protein
MPTSPEAWAIVFALYVIHAAVITLSVLLWVRAWMWLLARHRKGKTDA